MIKKIREDINTSRKNRDFRKLNILTTFLSEAEKVGKDNGNRETSDSEVVAVLKKFINNLKQIIEVLTDEDRISACKFEMEILDGYLPKQFSEFELFIIIRDIIYRLPEKNSKMMGKVMSELKSQYEGRYDGKLASKITKELLK